MKFIHRHHGQHLIIELEGRLYDQLLAGDIEFITQPHVQKSTGNLILDVSKLEHINSSGLNLLLKLLNTYKTRDRSVIVAGANQAVNGVFSITKLNTVFVLVDSLDEAVQVNNIQKIRHT